MCKVGGLRLEAKRVGFCLEPKMECSSNLQQKYVASNLERSGPQT